jgi:tRNA (mo5U34)-methyltransferase
VPAPTASAALAPDDLAARVRERQWYHTLELAPGVLTPGWFDVRPLAPQLPIPASLDGKRCLDVGTFDGFWAFEMERRGAAEVLAVDVLDPLAWDWPYDPPPAVVAVLEERKEGGAGFQIASAALASKVRYLERSIYELDSAELGQFDFVYVGSLILHLRDPVRALERVRSVCRGQLLSVDAYDPTFTRLFPRRALASLDGVGRPWWWLANLAGLQRLVEVAGFTLERPPQKVRMARGAGQPKRIPHPRILLTREGRRVAGSAWFGDPHAAILARPR